MTAVTIFNTVSVERPKLDDRVIDTVRSKREQKKRKRKRNPATVRETAPYIYIYTCTVPLNALKPLEIARFVNIAIRPRTEVSGKYIRTGFPIPARARARISRVISTSNICVLHRGVPTRALFLAYRYGFQPCLRDEE